MLEKSIPDLDFLSTEIYNDSKQFNYMLLFSFLIMKIKKIAIIIFTIIYHYLIHHICIYILYLYLSCASIFHILEIWPVFLVQFFIFWKFHDYQFFIFWKFESGWIFKDSITGRKYIQFFIFWKFDHNRFFIFWKFDHQIVSIFQILEILLKHKISKIR